MAKVPTATHIYINQSICGANDVIFWMTFPSRGFFSQSMRRAGWWLTVGVLCATPFKGDTVSNWMHFYIVVCTQLYTRKVTNRQRSSLVKLNLPASHCQSNYINFTGTAHSALRAQRHLDSNNNNNNKTWSCRKISMPRHAMGEVGHIHHTIPVQFTF